jgi:hypothetical protein
VSAAASRPSGTPLEAPQAPSNEDIARVLDEVAVLLEGRDANPFRALAYRRAASVLRDLAPPAAELLAMGGKERLRQLAGIGDRLARAIAEVVETGRLALLERLRGTAGPEALLITIPGLGHTLARRIHEELGVETLEELEMAAHDGRLGGLRGFGERRVRGITDALAGRLGRRGRRLLPPPRGPLPSVAELLDVDREYRSEADAGRLRRIAPRRFNPRGVAWLPILHTTRGDRHYTALFSNTPRAHELGKTGDWVVLDLDDGRAERQWTVVTETRGPLAGRRVVRGRESECRPEALAPGALRTHLSVRRSA